MANILTGSFGNANEQVFYGSAVGEALPVTQMIFPNGEKGTIGGGEFVTVTKYMTGLFGMQIPYVTTEFVPNKVVAIKRADMKVAENIAYADDAVVGDGSVMKGSVRSGAVMKAEAKPMQKSCPDGWRDDGLMCFEPLDFKCDTGVLENGLCMVDNGGFRMPMGVPRMIGGNVQSKF